MTLWEMCLSPWPPHEKLVCHHSSSYWLHGKLFWWTQVSSAAGPWFKHCVSHSLRSDPWKVAPSVRPGSCSKTCSTLRELTRTQSMAMILWEIGPTKDSVAAFLNLSSWVDFYTSIILWKLDFCIDPGKVESTVLNVYMQCVIIGLHLKKICAP